jgi:RNA polymerase sigma-70 factor (ECF subfamily)
MAGISLSDLFERTWRERSPMWRAYALRLTGNPSDADDVVHEATARTLSTGPDLDTGARLHAYVLTAIRNISLELVRNRGREVTLDERYPPSGRAYASSALQLALSGEARDRRRELADALRQELGRLPLEHRQVVEWILLRTPPLRLREVAERQGVATSTAHYRLNRALETLAEILRVGSQGKVTRAERGY